MQAHLWDLNLAPNDAIHADAQDDASHIPLPSDQIPDDQVPILLNLQEEEDDDLDNSGVSLSLLLVSAISGSFANLVQNLGVVPDLNDPPIVDADPPNFIPNDI